MSVAGCLGRGGVGVEKFVKVVALFSFLLAAAATYSRVGHIGTGKACGAGGVGVKDFSGVGLRKDPAIVCARSASGGSALRVCNSSGVLGLMRYAMSSNALFISFGGNTGVRFNGRKELGVVTSDPVLGSILLRKSKSMILGGGIGSSHLSLALGNSKSVGTKRVIYAGTFSTALRKSNSVSIGGDVGTKGMSLGLSNSNSLSVCGLATGSASTVLHKSKSLGIGNAGMTKSMAIGLSNSNSLSFIKVRKRAMGTRLRNSNSLGMTNATRQTMLSLHGSNSLGTGSLGTISMSTDMGNSNSVSYCISNALGYGVSKDNSVNCGNDPIGVRSGNGHGPRGLWSRYLGGLGV